jgi:hypothetical protein
MNPNPNTWRWRSVAPVCEGEGGTPGLPRGRTAEARRCPRTGNDAHHPPYPQKCTLKHARPPRVLGRAQFSALSYKRAAICRPHSSCVLSTLTFAHSTIRQDDHTSASRQQRAFRSHSLSSSYFKMRSSSRPAHGHHLHSSHSHRTPSRPHPRRFAFLRAPSAMFSISSFFSRFSTINIIRAFVYCTLAFI